MEFNHNFTVSEADVFVLIVFDFDTNVCNIRFIHRRVMRLIESNTNDVVRRPPLYVRFSVVEREPHRLIDIQSCPCMYVHAIKTASYVGLIRA